MVGKQRALVVVGSLTRVTPYFEQAHGAGIAVLAFHEDTGSLIPLSETAGVDNPTFLAVEPRRDLVFAVSEVFGWNEGIVSAYRLDRATGQLTYLNKQPSLGSLPAHLSVDRTGRYVFVTNYRHEIADEAAGQAIAVLPIFDDGRLGPPIASVQHTGRGPDDVRQSVPHPHSALINPTNRTLSAPDLSLDAVLHYRFDPSARAAALQPLARSSLALGAGPRHFAHAPDGRHAYVVNELNSTISAFKIDPQGIWSHAETLAVVPDGCANGNLCADIHVSPDGLSVYASNRGHDSISILRRDGGSGRLTLHGCVATGGRTPRNFALSPTGSSLIVANQNSDHLGVFRRTDDGTITRIGDPIPIGTPMCVKWM